MRSTSFLAPLLISQYALGFAPIQPRSSQQLTQQHARIDSSLNVLKTKLQQETTNANKKSPTKLMDPLLDLGTADSSTEIATADGWSYGEFAKIYPNVNNIGIATIKTASADLLAQVAIAHTPVSDIDWERALLFCAFGATYLGAFQYWYQVNVFKKLFDVDKFTSQPWGDKLKDTEGLKSLAAQTAVDLTVLTLIYLPTFYVFKAGVFSGSSDPSVWLSTGLNNYGTNFAKDEFDLLRVWAPADLVCFSVPLYLRLPARHVVSFVWTAYLSFSRGGH
ncbi:hypothetical protein ACHAXR_011030 [Thalassiosira sp. AJA248-18]